MNIYILNAFLAALTILCALCSAASYETKEELIWAIVAAVWALDAVIIKII